MNSFRKNIFCLEKNIMEKVKKWRKSATWYIAFSGGLDSTALLHALSKISRKEILPPLAAIHIHHNIQKESDTWIKHCQSFCESIQIPLRVFKLDILSESSSENTARQGRYKVFESFTKENEVIFLAQHKNDQAETMLFRLLRGSGLQGLSGMPRERPLGRGYLYRPLFDISRQDIEQYAKLNNLSWIKDPSNSDIRYSRNYLRHTVFPLLCKRWPRSCEAMFRTSEHCNEAKILLNEVAHEDMKKMPKDSNESWLKVPSLSLDFITTFSPERQRNLLRYWLSKFTCMPDTKHWIGWENLRDSPKDNQARWKLNGGEMRRTSGRIWWLSNIWLTSPPPLTTVAKFNNIILLPNNGSVQLSGGLICSHLDIRYRRGGEILSIPNRGNRTLKKVMNELHIPLFIRDRLPLLYYKKELITIANFPSPDSSYNSGWKLHWTPPTDHHIAKFS